MPAGRWSLLRAGVDHAPPDAMRFARLALRRWGVVVHEVVAHQTRMPPWCALLGALRTLEGAAKSVPAASRDVIAFRDGVPFEVGGELGAVLAQLKNAAALG